jgi:DNA-binding winged helix-turn-helix (wHTH) protein/tetratricopeptide (TPR) repeat protein
MSNCKGLGLTYCFGPFRLDLAAFQLTEDDRILALAPKSVDLLALFASQPMSLVTKDQILSRLWPDIAVTDNALTQVVSELRQALGDDPSDPKYVQTVPRRGYRFIAEVTTSSAQVPAPTSPGHPGSERRRRSIAVSDFKNLTQDPDVEWLSIGIAETMSNDLRALSEISLIDRAGLPVEARRGDLEALRASGLDWLVVGGYQRAADRLRMTARAISVTTGEAVAQAKTDGAVTDAFELQDRLVRQLLAGLQVPVSETASARIGTHETSSLDAYRAMTEGRLKLESLDPALMPDAIRDFDRALTIDPRYALAYVGLAEARFWLYEASRMRNRPDRDELRLAIGHARRAVELDAASGDAHASLALFLMAAGEITEGVASGRQAVALEPNDWRHHFRLGVAEWGPGRLSSLAEVERRYPDFGHSYFSMAMIHVASGSFDAASAVLERGIDRSDIGAGRPSRFPAVGLHWLLGLTRWAVDGDRAEVRRQLELECASATRPVYATEYTMNAYDGLGFLALEQGRLDDADQAFSQALESYPDHARSLIGRAMTCRARRQPDRVAEFMAHADKAIAELVSSHRMAEASMARAYWLIASDKPETACDSLRTMLDVAPPGTAGWTLPVEPWLAPLRNTPACRRVFARLAERAN